MANETRIWTGSEWVTKGEPPPGVTAFIIEHAAVPLRHRDGAIVPQRFLPATRQPMSTLADKDFGITNWSNRGFTFEEARELAREEATRKAERHCGDWHITVREVQS